MRKTNKDEETEKKSEEEAEEEEEDAWEEETEEYRCWIAKTRRRKRKGEGRRAMVIAFWKRCGRGMGGAGEEPWRQTDKHAI